MADFLDLETQDGVRMPLNVFPRTKQESTNCVVPVSAIYTPLKFFSNMRCPSRQDLDMPFSVFNATISLLTTHRFLKKISQQRALRSVHHELSVPPVFLFVVDTCIIEEELGYLKNALSQAIDLLPDNSVVGFITFGTYVHELGFGLIPKTYVLGIIQSLGKFVLKDVQKGAATTCYVALHPQVKGIGGEYFAADCNIAKPSSQAKDMMELAKELWEFSMSLTG